MPIFQNLYKSQHDCVSILGRFSHKNGLFPGKIAMDIVLILGERWGNLQGYFDDAISIHFFGDYPDPRPPRIGTISMDKR